MTKPVTKQILQFIEKEFIAKEVLPVSNNVNHIFSKKSQDFLYSCLEKLYHIKNTWTQQQKEYILSTATISNKIELGESFTYIPEDITKIIKTTPFTTYRYSFVVQSRTYNIHISVNPQQTTSLHKKIQKMVERIYLWLSFISTYTNKECSKNVDIIIYLTNCQKKLPEEEYADSENIVIDSENANTAFTTGCMKNTQIYIFREEEWFKVFIHETFHNLGIDFISMDQAPIEKYVQKIFPIEIENDIRVYEAYTEMCAELCHFLFVAMEHHSTELLSVSNMMETLQKIIYVETIFSLFQCSKILKWNHVTYRDICDKENAKKYKENTNVFSYYVLKTIFITNIYSFVDFIVNQPEKFRFHQTNRNRDIFLAFIKDSAVSLRFCRGIEYMEKWWREKKRRNKFETKTLRMTIYELA